MKTTSAAVAHAIAVNILDLPLSRSTVLVRSMPSDTLTEMCKCKANARKKSGAVAVDRIASMLNHGGLLRPENHRMSQAEYLSRPIPVFAKLAVMLRNNAAVQFVFARFAALLRSNKRSGEPLASEFLGEAPDVTGNADQPLAGLEISGESTVAADCDPSEREKLIHRRWTETGIKMWNPNVHGTGQAALNIQGHSDLLPVKPGGTLPRYDKLEFRLNGGRIVCEGVVVDPPKRRN
jgi:hypothetical protein